MSPTAEPVSRTEEIINSLPVQPKTSKQLTNGTATLTSKQSSGSRTITLSAGLFDKLFALSAEAKVWGIASKALTQSTPPKLYPEYTKPGDTVYVYRELEFWTSGFFPGSLYLLLERRKRYPHLYHEPNKPHDLQLEFACKWWTENLHQNAALEGTHDLGFMIFPWAKISWELNGDDKAMKTMITAAKTLSSRFSSAAGCIRSWDRCVTKKYDFQDPSSEFLVIIDNMMNLSLLFFVAEQTGDTAMRDVAIKHAQASARLHVREDASTTHLVVLSPETGIVRDYLTNQGFSHTSCWSRGQSWAIAGFAETFHWTKMEEFLTTARRCADYFLERLPSSGVAPWDFDAASHAAATGGDEQPPDTSATLVAAYGMLLIHKALAARGEQSVYLSAAMRMANAVCNLHKNPAAEYVTRTETTETVEQGVVETATGVEVNMGKGETILNGATINNYEFAPRRWADHGLVYADYYFLLFGNELLKMDLGEVLGHATE